MDDEEVTKFIKKTKAAVFLYAAIAILGGNTGNILDILRPESIEHKYVTPLQAHELESSIMGRVRKMQNECKDIRAADEKDLDKVRNRVLRNEIRVDECLRRTNP